MTTLLPAHLEALLSDAPIAPEWTDAELEAYATAMEARGLTEGPFAPMVSPVLLAPCTCVECRREIAYRRFLRLR